MLISTLLAPWVSISADQDLHVMNLTLDSRMVSAGDAFIAQSGQTVNGAAYTEEAARRGARLVLIESLDGTSIPFMQHSVLHVPLVDLAMQLPVLAERFYQIRETGIKLVGVTGTNGKTSCTHFLADIYQQAGISCGIIGTLGVGFYGALKVGSHTTPDILTLYREIKALSQAGAKWIAMEVSSHSIHQARIAGLSFETGVFTNLTQDHLDYHGTMDAYAAVKYHFLQSALTKKVVLNADDPYGQAWATTLSQHHPLSLFGTDKAVAGFPDQAIVQVHETRLLPQGIEARISSPQEEGVLFIPLLGDFNLSNALAVLSTLLVEGWSLGELLPYFRRLTSVPGRMQVMGGGAQPMVVIDYAHTPDALEKALSSLRHHTSNRLICVFGCGGDRDRSKRPLMGRIASEWADHVILTSDNPRSENPLTILDDIAQGVMHPHKVTMIADRSKAIENSIQYARSGDVVLIAGKGAECFQYVGNEALPFQDEAEVRHRLTQSS